MERAEGKCGDASFQQQTEFGYSSRPTFWPLMAFFRLCVKPLIHTRNTWLVWNLYSGDANMWLSDAFEREFSCLHEQWPLLKMSSWAHTVQYSGACWNAQFDCSQPIIASVNRPLVMCTSGFVKVYKFSSHRGRLHEISELVTIIAKLFPSR